MPTVNLLLDVTGTVTPGGADDGTITPGVAVTTKFDSIAFDETIDAVDHSTGQDNAEQNRKRKTGFTATIKTKLYNSDLQTAVYNNDLLRVIITAPTGFGCTIDGIVTKRQTTYDIPSEIEFQLKCYGTLPTFA